MNLPNHGSNNANHGIHCIRFAESISIQLPLTPDPCAPLNSCWFAIAVNHKVIVVGCNSNGEPRANSVVLLY